MKEFRTKKMSVKISCACVSNEYFDSHFRDYYDFLVFDIGESKIHGYYRKTFYKIKPVSAVISLGLDMNRYVDLPSFVCTAVIY